MHCIFADISTYLDLLHIATNDVFRGLVASDVIEKQRERERERGIILKIINVTLHVHDPALLSFDDTLYNIETR